MRSFIAGCIAAVVFAAIGAVTLRSEEHTSELQSQSNLVCRLLLEKKKYHDVFVTTSLHHGARWFPSLLTTEPITNGNSDPLNNPALPFCGDYATIPATGDLTVED